MKNLLMLLLVAVYITSCKNTENKAAEQPESVKPALASKNSDAFNESFEKLLHSYYSLKDAMIEADTAKANAASRKLSVFADSLKVAEIKNDSLGNIKSSAKNYAGTITGSALGLAGETEFARKKKEFQMISDAMYDLVRTVKYDKEKIYHEHCPMAINDTEDAYWLSNSSTIMNPYLGKKHPKYKDAMVNCGDVTDSLDFSR
jgi:PBP1b-binding outer membrane lipoprotein LpoB